MAVKHMPMSSLIIGIDLDPIRAIKGCKTLVGDITTQKSRQVRCPPWLTPSPYSSSYPPVQISCCLQRIRTLMPATVSFATWLERHHSLCTLLF